MVTRTLVTAEEIGNPRPADHGLLGWAYDPMGAVQGILVSAGYLFMTRVVARQDGTASLLYAYIAALGSSLTAGQNFAGLYDVDGNRLGQTADQTTAWGTTGLKAMALTSGVAVTVGTPYYVVLLSNGSTAPQFLRAAGGVASVNAGLTGPWRFQQEDTGSRTSLPATSSPVDWSAYSAALWVAIG